MVTYDELVHTRVAVPEQPSSNVVRWADDVGVLLDHRPFGNHEQHLAGDSAYFRRVTADLFAGSGEHSALAPELVRFSPGMPGIGIPGCHRDRASLAGAGDEERQSVLKRLRLAAGVDEAVVPPFVRRHVLTQKRCHDVGRLLEAIEPLSDRRQIDPVGHMLVLLPGSAEPNVTRPPDS